jgi:ketosteroid isomerase-like protein
MTSHTTISPQEAADRLAIRELVDAYAHCADRRDAKGQMALFTEDTRFLVFYDPTSEAPSQELRGRESLAPVFDDLNQYVATMHFNGQSTISLVGERATGESYCLAHHLSVAEDGQRTLMVASIRYLDEFVKQDGQWLFAERRLMVNWIDTRPSVALSTLAAAQTGSVTGFPGPDGRASPRSGPRSARRRRGGARRRPSGERRLPPPARLPPPGPPGPGRGRRGRMAHPGW